ncbi:hypothetical protein NHQ30_007598 [Ciborinia camelliae]|nr:hypothetical protein NHQ30_007598 [Ciborinia camelliae]
MEHERTPEAFKFMCKVMKAIKVSRIAVSDCSHFTASLNSPWASFYRMSNIENWSSSFRETLMYTTKHDLDINQQVEFVEWSAAHLELNRRQKQVRTMQIFKARPTFKKIKVIEKAQSRPDAFAKARRKERTKLNGVPTWLFEAGPENKFPQLQLDIMVEVGSIDSWEKKIVEDEGHDGDDEEPEEDEGIEDENSDDDVVSEELEDEGSEEEARIDEEPMEREDIEDESSGG